MGSRVLMLEEPQLPNSESIRGIGTWWSWFAVWTGTYWIKKQPIDLFKAAYTDQDIITRDERPNWRLP